MAPSFMFSNAGASTTLQLPVTVTHTSAKLRRLGGGHDLVALHVRLERLQRVHLAHDHAHAHALRAQGQARCRSSRSPR